MPYGVVNVDSSENTTLTPSSLASASWSLTNRSRSLPVSFTEDSFWQPHDGPIQPQQIFARFFALQPRVFDYHKPFASTEMRSRLPLRRRFDLCQSLLLADGSDGVPFNSPFTPVRLEYSVHRFQRTILYCWYCPLGMLFHFQFNYLLPLLLWNPWNFSSCNNCEHAPVANGRVRRKRGTRCMLYMVGCWCWRELLMG